MIEIEDLSFRYPRSKRDVISKLSLRIPDGCLFGLLGPNGSGKTTLISILSGLITPRQGEVRYGRFSYPHDLREIQTSLALVPQEYAFYPRLSVLENLHLFGQILSIPRTEMRPRVHRAMAGVSLEPFATVEARHLSGGLKRRLNLAIGLLNRPQYLFLDEPTAGMDPHARQFILDMTRRIHDDGTTVIYTSHYMEEVEALCDEIAVLDDGRLLASGTLGQILGEASVGVLDVILETPPQADQCRALAVVPDLKIDKHRLIVSPCRKSEVRDLLQILQNEKLGVVSLKYGCQSLEEWFLQKTKQDPGA